MEDEEMDEMDEVVVQIATTSNAEEYLGADKEDNELEGSETVECMSNNLSDMHLSFWTATFF